MKRSKKENDLRPVIVLVSGLLPANVTLFSSVIEGGLTVSCIKSIQRGTGSGNGNITIEPVDINKSVVLISGGKTHGVREFTKDCGSVPYAFLYDSTTLVIGNATATYSYNGSQTSTRYETANETIMYAWQVIEFA